MNVIWKTIFSVSCVLVATMVTTIMSMFIQSMELDRCCLQHLRLAANASTVDMAESQLRTAISWLERHKGKTGSTALIYRTPDTDYGYWLANLKASADELRQLGPDSTQTDRTNTLLKLRETIMDNDASGSYVAVPENLATFPCTGSYLCIMIAIAFSMVGLTILFFAVASPRSGPRWR